ncbi:UNVERIFIED_CONTAM: Beta,beta-carotene 15,15'-dioxygenase [Trichonephila clavipes]
MRLSVFQTVGLPLRGHDNPIREARANRKVIFRLMDRETGIEIETKYVTNAFFFFHHINTYEEDGHLVTDLITYADSNVLDCLFLDQMRLGKLPNTVLGGFTRFVLPLNTDGKQGSNLVTLKDTTAIAVKEDENKVLLIPERKGKLGNTEAIKVSDYVWNRDFTKAYK